MGNVREIKRTGFNEGLGDCLSNSGFPPTAELEEMELHVEAVTPSSRASDDHPVLFSVTGGYFQVLLAKNQSHYALFSCEVEFHYGSPSPTLHWKNIQWITFNLYKNSALIWVVLCFPNFIFYANFKISRFQFTNKLREN